MVILHLSVIRLMPIVGHAENLLCVLPALLFGAATANGTLGSYVIHITFYDGDLVGCDHAEPARDSA